MTKKCFFFYLENDKKTTMADSPSDSESNMDSKPKKKHRRRQKGGKHHRRWKPYDKMSWKEKQALEEKETARATQKREEAFASGHPVAPYNTTQFLMDDHCKSEAYISPDLHRHNSKESNASNSSDTSSEFYDDDENEGFQQKNFMDTFNDFRMQELMNKTKEALVRDYVDLEMRLERMQDTAKSDSKRSSRDSSESYSSSSGSDRSRDDFTLLKAENERLKTQYTSLLAKVGDTDSVQSSDAN